MSKKSILLLVAVAVFALIGGFLYQSPTATMMTTTKQGDQPVNLLSPPLKGVVPSPVDTGVWFDDLKMSQVISGAEGERVADYIFAKIFSVGEDVEPPDSLIRDDQRRILFISLSDGEGPAVVIRGSGENMGAAVDNLLDSLGEYQENGFALEWAKVDIVQEVFELKEVDLSTPLPFERSLYGLAFDRLSNLAFLPEELVARTLVNSDQEFRFDKMSEYLERDGISTQ